MWLVPLGDAPPLVQRARASRAGVSHDAQDVRGTAGAWKRPSPPDENLETQGGLSRR